MNAETEVIKKVFESWVKHQLNIYNLDWDDEEGYLDPTINAMWVGFCGGWMLSD